MKDCVKIRAQIRESIDNGLSLAIEKHLLTCPDCQQYREELLLSRGLLKSIPPQKAPPKLKQELRERIDQMTTKKEKNKNFKIKKIQLSTPLLAASFLMVILLTISVLYVVSPWLRSDQDLDHYVYSSLESQTLRRLPTESFEPTTMNDAISAEKTTDLARKIIYTAQMILEVDDPELKQSEILGYISNANGFVAETRRWITNTDILNLRMTLRVPAAIFEQTLTYLAQKGEVKDESLQGQDITAQYYDLTARLTSKRAQEERYLEILTQANTVEDILRIERELERIRVEIESMEGTLRYYQDRTDLATITLTMRSKATTSFIDISGSELLKKVVESFLTSVQSLIIIVVTLIPWLILALFLILILRFVIKRIRG